MIFRVPSVFQPGRDERRTGRVPDEQSRVGRRAGGPVGAARGQVLGPSAAD